MSLQIAKAPYSVPFKKWLLSHLFPAEFSKYHTNLGASIGATIQETFETDGINISDGSYTLAPEFIDPATLPKVRRGITDGFAWRGFFSFVMVLLGLPSRPTTIIYTDESLDEQPMMLFKQFGLNLIGGWDSDPKISLEKKIWQWVSLLIKIFIILPIKLLTFPIKFLINMLKLYTEWVPLLFATLCAASLGAYSKTWLGSRKFPSRNKWQKSPGESLFLLLLVGLLKLPHLILGTLYFAFRLVALVGRAITSPEKSIRMALNYGREVKIQFGESPAGIWFGHLLSNIIGVVGVLISLSITATLWIILLPLGFSFISAHIPVLVKAFTWFSQLPAVVATMTWFSQVPFITASLGVAHGALASLGLIISSVFGPAITTLGALIGLKISVGVMMTSTAIGLIGAIVLPALTTAGDFLSNRWASWTHGGPFTTLFNPFTPEGSNLMRMEPLTEEAVPAEEKGDHAQVDYIEDGAGVPLEKAEALGTSLTKSLESANQAADFSINKKENQRHAQQGFLKSAQDFGDLYERELRETIQVV